MGEEEEDEEQQGGSRGTSRDQWLQLLRLGALCGALASTLPA